MPLSDPAAVGRTLPLRDIHLPPAPGWWPPAPGWWLLGILLVAFSLLLLLLRRRFRRLRYRREALRRLFQLEAGDLSTGALVAELSALLRRAALCAYPREGCAGLSGEDWLRFLDRPLKESPFSKGAGRCLADGPYRMTVEVDRQALLALCRRWLKRLPPQLRRGGRRRP